MSFRNLHLRAVILACLKCWPLAPCKLSVAISAANDFMDTPVTDLVRDHGYRASAVTPVT